MFDIISRSRWGLCIVFASLMQVCGCCSSSEAQFAWHERIHGVGRLVTPIQVAGDPPGVSLPEKTVLDDLGPPDQRVPMNALGDLMSTTVGLDGTTYREFMLQKIRRRYDEKRSPGDATPATPASINSCVAIIYEEQKHFRSPYFDGPPSFIAYVFISRNGIVELFTPLVPWKPSEER